MAAPPKLCESVSRSFSQKDDIFLLHTASLPIAKALAHSLYHGCSRLVIIVDVPEELLQEINFHLSLLKQTHVLQKTDIRADAPELLSLSKTVKEKRRKLYVEGGFFCVSLQIALLDLLSPEKTLNCQDVDRLILMHDGRPVSDAFCHHAWLATLMKLNSSQTRIVFCSQFPRQFRGDQLEQAVRLLFLKRVAIWPFGRAEIHELLKQHPLTATSHKLSLNSHELQLEQLYRSLEKFCADNPHERKQVRQVQHLLINENKLAHLCRIQQLVEESPDWSIWKSCSSVVMEIVTNILKTAKNCVYNLIYTKDQSRPIDLLGLISAHPVLEPNEEAEDAFQGREASKAYIYQLTYQLHIPGLCKQADELECPIYPAKFSEFVKMLTQRVAEGVTDEVEKEESVEMSQMREIVASNFEKNYPLWTAYVVTNSERLTNSLAEYVGVYNCGNGYHEYMRKLLKFLEQSRPGRTRQIQRILRKMERDKSDGAMGFTSDKIRIEEEEPILLEELYQELRRVDEILVHYAATNSHNELCLKEIEQAHIAYCDRQALLRIPNPQTHQALNDCLLIADRRIAVTFQRPLCPEQLLSHIRVLSPEVCVFWNPNHHLLRSLSIAHSEADVVGLQQLRVLCFEGSAENEEVTKAVKEEDEAFWSVAQQRRNLGCYDEKAELRIKELIIDDELHKRAAMINLAEGMNPLRMEPSKHRANPQKLLRVHVDRTVLVDKREFKSLLPSFLYHCGFQVVPVFLEVADYILSNEIAIEKKSVHTHDLHESLRSGRLHEQAKKLVSKFKHPILLIECPDQSYLSSAQLNSGYNNATGEKYKSNTLRQLTELMGRFPKLGICWSTGYLQTIEFFKQIMQNELAPELSRFKPQGEPEFDEEEEAALGCTE